MEWQACVGTADALVSGLRLRQQHFPPCDQELHDSGEIYLVVDVDVVLLQLLLFCLCEPRLA